MVLPSPANRRPRWYHDLRWFAAGLVLVVVTMPLYGLFRPDAAIVISPATTVITAPLAADGLPDYAAHVLTRMGRGTPPDENAAVPLLMALWPLEIDAADLPAVCKELRIDVPSPPPEAFQDPLYRDAAIRVAIEGNLADHVADGAEIGTRVLGMEWAVSDAMDAARDHPWRAADLPAPAMLRDTRRAVLESPPLQVVPRASTNALRLRAMWHLGGGRPTESWRDILAMHRFAGLLASANGGVFEPLLY